MKTKLLRLLNGTKNFILETLKFIGTTIALVSIGVGTWILFGLLYVGTAKFVGEWLKLVIQYMN